MIPSPRLQLFLDLFFPTTTSIASNHLCNESLLVLWLSLWLPEAPSPQVRNKFLLNGRRDVSIEITDQQVVLLGNLLARDDLDIAHMLAEGFTKEHMVNLSPLSPEVKVIRWLGCFLKQVLMTSLQDMTNGSSFNNDSWATCPNSLT